MSIAALIRAMAVAGAPPEAIALAVDAIEAAQAAVEAKRAVERDRKRRQRERDNAGTVTGQSRDGHAVSQDEPLSLPPNENNSNPPTHTPVNITPARGPWDQHVLDWREWRKTHPFPRPWWAEKQAWADWLDVRKTKKCRNTITAHNGFLADVDRHSCEVWPPGRLLKHAVERSWTSIHRPHENQGSINGRVNTNTWASSPNGADRRSNKLRAIDEAIDFLGS